MKTRSILAVLIFLATSLNAQVPGFDWARQLSGDAFILSMTTDQAGDFYATGAFTGTVDFDPGAGVDTLADAGFGDIFIMKMSPSGSLIWAKRIGGTSYDEGNAITTDANGNVYVAGFFETDSVDFDPGPGVFLMSGDQNSFVLKLTTNGDFVWAKQLAGTPGSYAVSLALDRQNNILATGAFSGTVDFDPNAGTSTLTSAGSDIYIWKLDNNGNYIWARQIASISTGSRSYSIASDNAGDVFVSGLLIGTTDMDPGPGVNNLTSMGNFASSFLLRLDASGNFVWARQIDDADIGLAGSCVLADTGGNTYLGGSFSGTVDFDPGAGVHPLTAAAGQNYFILKLDGNGNLLWVNPMADVKGIASDDMANVYVCGNSIKKFSPGGFNLWTLDSSLSSRIVVDHFGELYVSGAFSGTVDFDPGQAVYNLSDTGTGTFIQKLNQDSILAVKGIASAGKVLSVYPNPTNDVIYVLSNAPGKYVLINSTGQVVRNIRIENNKPYLMRISQLPDGLYLLSEEQRTTAPVKIIVHH